MVEALDKEWNRQQNRLDPGKVLKPVEAHSMEDIKALVSQLDPAKNVVAPIIPLATQVSSNDVQGKPVVYNVSAQTKSKSKREMIIEGLDVIKKRMDASQEAAESGSVEVNGVVMKSASLGNGISGQSWVDPLLKQWFGAYRVGVTICWDLSDGYRYEYNIYEHQLSRVRNDAAKQS